MILPGAVLFTCPACGFPIAAFGTSKVRSIERIKHFPPELQIAFFRDAEFTMNARIREYRLSVING